MGVSVSGEGLGRIAEGIAFLKSHKVRIGIPDGGGGGSGGLSNVQLAFILTNGSPVNHNPPRPFLEPALAQPKARQQIARHMKAAAKAALEGDTGGAMDQMHMAGQAGEDAVKDYMASGAFAPNSGFTINGGWMRNRVSGKPFHADPKGSSKPLIDTGNLQGSITHVVE